MNAAWFRDYVAPMGNEPRAEARAPPQSGAVAESSGAQAQSGAVAESSGAQAQSGAVAESSGAVAESSGAQAQNVAVARLSTTIVRRSWPGKWGRKAELVPMTVLASKEGEVEMDPALWGELHRHIHMEEMVVAKLPLHGFYKARGVCKRWNSLPWNRSFLERHSTTSLPKPYFVLHGKQGCHQAILMKDAMLETWVLRPLPAFAFQHIHTSLDRGVVCTCADEGRYTNSAVRGTIFNMHTKVFRRLPPLTVASGDFEIAMIAVDERSGTYYVLVAARNGREIWVFDSLTAEWSAKSAPRAPFSYVDDSTHCDGVMYIKWRGHLRDVIMPPDPADNPAVPGQVQPRAPWLPRHFAVLRPFGPRRPPPPPPPHVILAQRPKMFAYSFRDDTWTDLPMAPPPLPRVQEEGWQDTFVQGLGEWRGALRDVTFHSADALLRVWEFERSRQEWLEIDRMPATVLDWFLDAQASKFDFFARRTIKTSYCEHYILMWNYGFPRTSGVVRLVLYDMALKSWKPLEVAKDWSCSDCPSVTYPFV